MARIVYPIWQAIATFFAGRGKAIANFGYALWQPQIVTPEAMTYDRCTFASSRLPCWWGASRK
jgi:hypothetical protein